MKTKLLYILCVLTTVNITAQCTGSVNIPDANFKAVSSFAAADNPNLGCIQVDNTAYSIANWTNIDATASFSENRGVLNISDFSIESMFLYPNPSTSMLNIEMETNLKQATIYSILGAKVLKTKSNAINIINLKSGLYLIKIENETGRVTTKRFVKQ